jgi:WD40 repeat protein
LALTTAPGSPHLITVEGSTFRIRDAATGKILRESSSVGTGFNFALSDDGKFLASMFPGKGVFVRGAVDDREPSWLLTEQSIREPTFDATGAKVAALTDQGTICVWDRRTGVKREFAPDSVNSHRDLVRFKLSSGGRLLATSAHGTPGGYQPMRLWDVQSGRQRGEIPCWTDDSPICCLFLPDLRSMLVGVGRAPRIWHYDPEPDPPQPTGHKDEAWAVAYSPDGLMLASGSNDSDERMTVKLWETASGREILGWNGGEGTVCTVAFSPDGRLLATGHLASQNNLRIWNASSGRLLKQITGHPQRIRCLAFTPDGKAIAAAGGHSSSSDRDWKVRLWSLESELCVREFDAHTDTVRSLAISRDGRMIASAGNDKSAFVWDIANGRLLAAARGVASFSAIALAPDGQKAAVADEGGAVTVWDTATMTNRVSFRATRDVLINLAYSHDSRSIASCGKSGVIRVWDAETGQTILELRGHKGQVNSVAIAPDNSSLASCSHDGEVRIWRAGSPRSGIERSE